MRWRDYAAMADMFMEDPPAFEELLAGLEALEVRINRAGAGLPGYARAAWALRLADAIVRVAARLATLDCRRETGVIGGLSA